MTRASIECAACGTTSHVPVSSVLLDAGGPGRENPDAGADAAGSGPLSIGGMVTWICRPCGDVISRPVTWSVLSALLAAGAHLLDEDDPRPEHPEAPPSGPVLTPDDVLDLHTALDDPAWFDALLTDAGGIPAA